MKKSLLLSISILLLAAGCTQTITEQQAVTIACGKDLSSIQYNATLENGDWHIACSPKPQQGLIINGGSGAYVVDGKTGKITSEILTP